MGGYFTGAGSVTANYIAEWNGSTWSALGSGTNKTVWTIAGFNGNLYAGGDFTMAGGNSANYIAMWNGSTWSPLGSGTNIDVEGLMGYKGKLYVGGQFKTAGGIPANYIATWDPGTVGVNEIADNNSLTIYPNPSNGKFAVQIDNGQLASNNKELQIDVYNILGEKVFSKMANSPITIDIGNQPKGIYIYRVTSEDGKYLSTGKLIKE